MRTPSNPRLSIILNTYNKTTWLREAIESILNQSVSSDLYEIIIADDCSTNEETRKIIEEYVDNHDNVRAIMLQKNQGNITRGRNLGIDVAKGENVCFMGYTRIETKKGFKPIKNIKIGDLVKTHQGNFKKVINISAIEYKQGSSLIEIHTSYSKIACTPDHPFLIQRKNNTKQWKQAKDLTNEDFLLYPYQQSQDILTFNCITNNIGGKLKNAQLLATISVDRNLARFLGLYLAEGCSGHDSIRFTLGNHESELIDFIQTICYVIFKRKPTIHKKWATTIKLNIRSLAPIFTKWFGKKASEKRIPDFIFEWNLQNRLAFIKGYIEGDGHITSSHSVQIITASQKLVKDLDRLCKISGLSFDASGEIKPNKSYINGYFCNSKLHYWICLSQHNYWKICDLLNASLANNALTNTYLKIPIRLVKGRNMYRSLNPHLQKVYNLEVEEDDSYIAESFIVHNCFIDDDNRRKSHYVETILNAMDSTDAHIVICRSEIIEEDGRRSGRIAFRDKPTQPDFQTLKEANYIDSGETCIRKEVFEWLGGIDEAMTCGEDWEFMLRVIQCVKVESINDVLCEYRQHKQQRGNLLYLDPHNQIMQDRARILRRLKDYGKKYRICLAVAKKDVLTESQRDMIERVYDLFQYLSEIIQVQITDNFNPHRIASFNPNLILVYSPFRISEDIFKMIQFYVNKERTQANKEIVSVMTNIEDPYAFDLYNRNREKYMDWIGTNEENCIEQYRNLRDSDIAKGRVFLFPTLSPCWSDDVVLQKEQNNQYEVVMINYAYPDRGEFIQSLGQTEYKLTIIGNGWADWKGIINNPNVQIIPFTISRKEMMSIYKSAKLILVKKRQSIHHPSVTPSRGFIETFSGTATLINDCDNIRQYFEPDKEIILYNGVEELNEKIKYYLANDEIRENIAKRGQEKAQQYTFEKRLLRMVNNIRCNRLDTGVDVLYPDDKIIYV